MSLDENRPSSTTSSTLGIFSDMSAPVNTLPLVYSDKYNISLYGIEKMHPFDSQKYGRIFKYLVDQKVIGGQEYTLPDSIEEFDLLLVHSPGYLALMNKGGSALEKALEIPMIGLLPNSVLKAKILDPMISMTGGTVAALRLAMKFGWSINLGGGFHHASPEKGEGFCIYSDVPIAIRKLRLSRDKESKTTRVLLVDVDAHQGNGFSRCLANDPETFIVDIYHAGIFPDDKEAASKVHLPVYADSTISDDGYLMRLQEALRGAIGRFNRIDLVVYNAGTDCLKGDPLGKMRLSEKCIQDRDAMVFRLCQEHRIPIAMVLSGGYQKDNARVISQSIVNLDREFELFKKAREIAKAS